MTTRVLPIFPHKIVLFPNQALPLRVAEEAHKTMFEDCLVSDRLFGVVLGLPEDDNSQTLLPHPVGTVARIDDWSFAEDGQFKIKTLGVQRFRLLEFIDSDKPYLSAVVEFWDDDHEQSDDVSDVITDLSSVYADYLSLIVLLANFALPARRFHLPQEPTRLSYHVASNIEVELMEKQRLLEEPSAIERLRRELSLVRRERDFLQRLISLQGIFFDTDSAWGQTIAERPT